MLTGKKKLKVVLDTNVYISALLFSGIPETIIELARDGDFELIISPDILFETGRILQEKFKFSKQEALYALSEIRRIATIVYPKTRITHIKDDPTDNRILECASEGSADYLVTGDKKHLRKLEKFQSCTILLPAEFIKKDFHKELYNENNF